MKKLFAFFAVFSLLFLSVATFAQEEVADSTKTEVKDSTTVVDEKPAAVAEVMEITEEELSAHQQIKKKFIEGGAGFMGVVLLALILGLALSIERIIYLNLASTNTDKLLKNVEKALNEGGVDAAKEVCRSTRGPVASIFYQGLDRAEEGVEMVEKSVVAYGSVQMGLLEKGAVVHMHVKKFRTSFSWPSFFILKRTVKKLSEDNRIFIRYSLICQTISIEANRVLQNLPTFR